MVDRDYESKNKEIKFGIIIKSAKRLKKMAANSAMELPPGVYFKPMNADEEEE